MHRVEVEAVLLEASREVVLHQDVAFRSQSVKNLYTSRVLKRQTQRLFVSIYLEAVQ